MTEIRNAELVDEVRPEPRDVHVILIPNGRGWKLAFLGASANLMSQGECLQEMAQLRERNIYARAYRLGPPDADADDIKPSGNARAVIDALKAIDFDFGTPQQEQEAIDVVAKAIGQPDADAVRAKARAAAGAFSAAATNPNHPDYDTPLVDIIAKVFGVEEAGR